MADLHAERIDYSGTLLPHELSGLDPWAQFEAWFADATAEQQAGRLAEPNAMMISTAVQRPDGWQPRSRVVLLKEYDRSGLVFFTNHDSAKGAEIEANPLVGVHFWWPSLMRQIRIEGGVSLLSRERSEAYFAQRPRPSQLGAWASAQSRPIADRDELVRAEQQAEERFAGRPVPCPPNWGGYLISPTLFEFWQGQPGRLHDRVQVTRDEGVDGQSWSATRLQP